MEGTPPAIWVHISTVYDAMEKAAEDGVYQGFTTKLVTRDLNIPVPYYGKILSILIDMGCIEQEQRGGGTSPSRWRLQAKPDLETFSRVYEATPNAKAPQARMTVVEERLQALEARLSGLDVKQALTDLSLEVQEVKGKQHSHEGAAV